MINFSPLLFLEVKVNPLSLSAQVSRCVEDDVIFCLIDLLVLFNASDIDLENRSFCEETQVIINYAILILKIYLVI